MNYLRMGLLIAMLLATLTVNGEEIALMKQELAKMQAEMEALRAEQATLNSSNEPGLLKSANGNAEISIGGDLRIRYGIGISNGYGRTNSDGESPNANFKSTSAGWAIERLALSFDLGLSADTAAVIGLRLDGYGYFGQAGNILDQAFWVWKNVGGTPLELKIGLTDAPFGMWLNTDMGGYDWDGVDRALIAQPFVISTGNISPDVDNTTNNGAVGGFYGAVADELARDFSAYGAPGIYTKYAMFDEQLIIKFGVMAAYNGGNIGRTTAFNDLGLNTNNGIRNIGLIDHVVAVGYNPSWIEGLHLEAAYLGRFDAGMGYDDKITNPFNQDVRDNYNGVNGDTGLANHGDTVYVPTLDLGVNYKINEKWTVAAEVVGRWNPHFADGFDGAFSTTADYRLTEKLILGAGFDWMYSRHTGNRVTNLNALTANVYRFSLGGKYDFGNGVYFQTQYYHQWMTVAGVDDSQLKDADVILFQTGYQF